MSKNLVMQALMRAVTTLRPPASCCTIRIVGVNIVHTPTGVCLTSSA